MTFGQTAAVCCGGEGALLLGWEPEIHVSDRHYCSKQRAAMGPLTPSHPILKLSTRRAPSQGARSCGREGGRGVGGEDHFTVAVP